MKKKLTLSMFALVVFGLGTSETYAYYTYGTPAVIQSPYGGIHAAPAVIGSSGTGIHPAPPVIGSPGGGVHPAPPVVGSPGGGIHPAPPVIGSPGGGIHPAPPVIQTPPSTIIHPHHPDHPHCQIYHADDLCSGFTDDDYDTGYWLNTNGDNAPYYSLVQ